MRVLVLSKYGRQAASPRHRFLAYEADLAQRGIHLEFSPLLDDEYLSRKLSGGSASLRLIITSYLKRILTLTTSARKYDLLLIHCELFPYFPSWFEQLVNKVGIPYIFDYDDAIFHMYDDHKNGAVRALLAGKIARVISGASAVIAGSGYLAEYARQYNDSVHVIPTVVDLDRYRVKDWEARDDDLFTIGWIGSPSTAPYLNIIKQPLSDLGNEGRARLLVIGAESPAVEGIEVEAQPWSEDTEVKHLLRCDVGVMPLPDEKWARGKCAFKLIQYMACGLPVIASPVGANVDVVTPEVGLLASSAAQWSSALHLLSSDPEVQHRLGQAGRRRCAQRYSLKSQSQVFASTLLDAVQHAAGLGSSRVI